METQYIIQWFIFIAAAAGVIYGIVMLFREKLRPGRCECGHIRCNHQKGKLACCAMMDHAASRRCSCQVFIPRDSDDDRGRDAPTPTPQELEHLFRLM